MFDFAIIGGGILGLAVAERLLRELPASRVVVLEKEAGWAKHQTGRNSGVIHSGIYYKPGSYKARFARAGNESMVRFCVEHGIRHEICGKLIVATEPEEVPRLEQLFERGRQNGLLVTRLSDEEAREVEPHARCLAAIQVPSTGIVDYTEVCGVLARLVKERGADLRLGTELIGAREREAGCALETTQGDLEAKWVINCAGLQTDRVARKFGENPGARIVPFRGEYFELARSAHHLVKGLIYPVPDPQFPFLGVHLTRMVGGGIHAGPNAVLALKREGYDWRSISLRDLSETLLFPGFWRLAARHYREGYMEVRRSLSRERFLKSLQRLVPEIQQEHLIPAPAGVRAQALFPDGRLVDDFLIARGRRSLHLCNAPSPAATASLEIGRAVVEMVLKG